jgi:hypothetical protein
MNESFFFFLGGIVRIRIGIASNFWSSFRASSEIDLPVNDE